MWIVFLFGSNKPIVECAIFDCKSIESDISPSNLCRSVQLIFDIKFTHLVFGFYQGFKYQSPGSNLSLLLNFHYSNSVAGRNPEPLDIENIPYFSGFQTKTGG